MFSDRRRKLKMVTSVVLLAALGWFHAGFSMDRPEGYRAFIKAPNQHDGSRVLLPIWEVTHIRDANMYSLSKSVRDVPIVGSSQGLSVGDTVTVIGHFRATDGAVLVDERIDHPWRKAKGLLSILALLFGASLVPRFFGLESGRVVLRG